MRISHVGESWAVIVSCPGRSSKSLSATILEILLSTSEDERYSLWQAHVTNVQMMSALKFTEAIDVDDQSVS